ncbi:hypothetical protein LCGC14_0028750 [marine sediment metagenome]|jgi:hypothetical protein|uniref:Uncharacterized protein n=1 Tax=marine sediment metagenome TaxID=412755 RepID=A0A0F9VZ94_9ZZZZ|nr:hypothetical protein HALO156_140089 [Halomonas sp. 156]CAD5282228.1 hypothetical protein HALO113_80009 [Halomonas sp. 113]CAD5292984.1 hypothetical protein HALOI3_60184 [Halomonas sp. I3]VXB17995.1 hypothetical protein HALO153_110308 [Halomonas titanicae]VXC26266.1 hypothetical protein HALO98_50486 [Halomonas titanicae]
MKQALKGQSQKITDLYHSYESCTRDHFDTYRSVVYVPALPALCSPMHA